jgi:hypothetical protein
MTTATLPDREKLTALLARIHPAGGALDAPDLDMLMQAAEFALETAPIEVSFIGGHGTGQEITAHVTPANLHDAEQIMTSLEMLNFALASYLVEGAKARSVARPGGVAEEGDLATAREALKRKIAAWLAAARYQHDWRRTDLLAMSDEAAGRMIKSFVAGVEDWAGREWADKAKLTVGLGFMANAQLVKMAHDSNAGMLRITLEDVTLDGKSAGDWLLRLERLEPKKGATR